MSTPLISSPLFSLAGALLNALGAIGAALMHARAVRRGSEDPHFPKGPGELLGMGKDRPPGTRGFTASWKTCALAFEVIAIFFGAQFIMRTL
ncbi:MAG: hypothetical protein AAF604_14030 [Acidobacteriota bacterium]